MSDKELDDLFKEASGNQNNAYDTSDWQKMEELLDASGGPRRGFRNWKTYTSLSLLLLIGTTASVVWMSGEKTKPDLSPRQEQALSENKSSSAEIESDHVNTQDDSEINLPDNGKKEEITHQVGISKPVIVQNGRLAKRKEQSHKEKIADRLMTGSDKKSGVDKDIMKVYALNENVQVSEANTTTSAIATLPVVDEPDLPSDSVPTVITDEEFNQKDSSEEKASDKRIPGRHSFSLKAALSPDFSSVGYFTPGETGFNYGLLAEYGLGEHFSVLIGGIWSKKLYASESAEAYAYGQSTNSKKITGDCRILDIPILVNYYINPGHRFVVYGSTGLSSYIMFKESYNYEVVKNGKSYDYNTTVERKNNEWLKMANFSLGVQYRLTNKWSLQAEPFVKVPLSGIGEGDIKLVSSGVFINVKYTFK